MMGAEMNMYGYDMGHGHPGYWGHDGYNMDGDIIIIISGKKG